MICRRLLLNKVFAAIDNEFIYLFIYLTSTWSSNPNPFYIGDKENTKKHLLNSIYLVWKRITILFTYK
ncbi:hypothetical protein CS528_01685 [Mesoplasma entomophilum]|uniref:Uncharacterized protein n=1 Tax=Mesoplasma entomophilum TaxID=2149 RepID=A0A3S5XZP2_9MOLU|nr:hypothetical protein CS528_01685 [Mesoplasma entomophilum]